MEVRDVQERWVERKEEFDEVERRGWEEEARREGRLPEEGGVKVVRRDARERGEHGEPGGEDELVAAQRRWEEERAKGGGGGTRVVRKG